GAKERRRAPGTCDGPLEAAGIEARPAIRRLAEIFKHECSAGRLRLLRCLEMKRDEEVRRATYAQRAPFCPQVLRRTTHKFCFLRAEPVAHQIDAAHARRDRERGAGRRRVELSAVGADRARDVGLAGLLEKCPEGLEGDPADRAKYLFG